MAGRAEKAMGEFLGDADEMLGWSKLVLELKTLSESAGDAWNAVLRLFEGRRAEEVGLNRSYNDSVVEPALLDLWAARERALAECDRQETEVRCLLSEAELAAAAAASVLLLAFDPKEPGKVRAEAVAPLSVEAHSFREGADLGIEAGGVELSAFFNFIATIAVGAFFGVSLMSALGYLSPPRFAGDSWVLLGFAALLGWAAVDKASRSVGTAFRIARTSVELREPIRLQAKKRLLAFATLGVVLAVETAVDAKGLLSRDRILASASFDGSTHASPTMWIVTVASAVTVSYGIYAAFAGWSAPSRAAANRVALAQETEARSIRSKERGDMHTVSLFAAANRVDVLRAQLARIAELRLETESTHARRLAVVTARKRSEDPSLPVKQYQVLRQLLHEIRGRSADYYRLVRAYLEHVEGRLRPKRWWHTRGRG